MLESRWSQLPPQSTDSSSIRPVSCNSAHARTVRRPGAKDSPQGGNGNSSLSPLDLFHAQNPGIHIGPATSSQLVSKPHQPPVPTASASSSSYLRGRNRRQPGDVDSPLLNKFIKDCRTWQDLSVLVAKHGPQFNFIHIAAALTHLAQLKSAAASAASSSLKHSFPCMLSPASAATLQAASESAWPRCLDSSHTSSMVPEGASAPSCSPEYLALMESLLFMASSSMHQFGARQATNTMWALAHLHPHPGCSALICEILHLVRLLLPWCEPQQLSNSIWAAAHVGLPLDDAWLEDFLVASERAMPGFQTQHLANTIWGLGRLGIAPDATWMSAYFMQLERLLHSIAPIDVSHILHGLATLGFEPDQGQTAVLTRLHQRLLQHQTAVPAGGAAAKRVHTSSQAIANTIWALATLSIVPSKAWMDEVYAEVQARLHEFEPQALSSFLWSAATLGQPLPAPLMQQIYQATLPHLAAFPPRSLSNILWAVAASQPPGSVKLSATAAAAGILPPKPWTAAFLAALHSQLPSFSDQAVSNALWALAKLQVPLEPTLASAVVQHLQQLEAADTMGTSSSGGISGQALANSLWALAKMGFSLSANAADVLVGMVGRRLLLAQQGAKVEARVQGHLLLRPSELASVMYSFAKLKLQPNPELLQLMLDAIAAYFPKSSTVRAPESVPQNPPAVTALSSLQQPSVVPKQHRLSTQDLSNIIWAVSTLGINPGPAWMAAFWGACCKQLSAFNTKDLAQTTYSLAKLGWNPSHLQQQQQQEQPEHLQQVMAAPGVQGMSEAALALAPTTGQAALPPPALVPRSRAAVNAGSRALGGEEGSSGRSDELPPGAALLLAEAATAFPRCNSQDVANLSWGLAQMGLQPRQAWCRGLADLLVRRSDQLHGSHLATSLWALGKMGFKPDPRSLLQVEGALYRRMPALKPRELAACTWAFAAMGYTPDVEWLEALCNQCMLTAAEFSQQDWSVVVYSLAGIAEQEQDAVIYLEDLFISPQLEAQVHKFSPSTLAMLTYACGVLGTRSARLLNRLLSAAQPHLADFKAQELSAVVCSAARLQHVPDAAFLAAWLRTFESRMVTLAGPVLAACAWALASLGVDPAPEWQRTFGCVLSERLSELTAREVAMVVWALGQWATPLDPQLVARIGKRVGACQPEYNRTVRRNLVWAMMKLKSKSKATVRKGFSAPKAGDAKAAVGEVKKKKAGSTS